MKERIASLETHMGYVKEGFVRVEARLDRIDGDIRSLLKTFWTGFVITWAGLIVGALGLAGLMAKGFGWL